MEVSAGGAIIHCPYSPYIAERKISCGFMERYSSVDSYSPVDNNILLCSRRDNMPSSSNRKALQANRERLAVELSFWAIYWRGAD